ncbi:MAG: zinc-ribbon domain-containing protein [Candidatus Thorarchaeota archaeon]
MVQDVSKRRFVPPREGVLPGETILWSRRAGFTFWMICFGFSMLIVPLMFLEDIEISLTDPSSIVFPGLIAFLILFFIVSFVNVRRTRYYLTSQRVLVVRGGHIRKEIPLSHFAGRPLSQFMETKVMYTENDRPIYRIRFYDPMSDEVIDFKGIDSFSVGSVERLSETVECPFCGYDNTTTSKYCRNCGAVL